MAGIRRLTKGTISEIDEGSISISDHMKELKIEKGTRMLLISSKSNFIRVIPIGEGIPSLLRVSLSLNLFAKSAKVLYTHIKDEGLNIIHSTGFCPLEEYCVWEGYFLLSSSDELSHLIDWFNKQEGVLNTEVESLQEQPDESLKW
ncbi:hypothetical protein EU537_04540 [Candidatus Thorarchaeota archaeon]|nr:MAG: hypothetical protein EU537_04540 [Candidatus Thorarchaeota archaeon]